MKILHYSLGFPPFRRGGMTKYCMDLMAEQTKQGYEASLLWPGAFKRVDSSILIKSHGSQKISKDYSVGSFELRNSLPVPLLNGICDIDAYTQSKDTDSLKRFLIENEIDVLHVHTLMGFPKELLEVCHLQGIRTVFTSHDYFGICPKWGLERNGKPCIDDHNCYDCVACNQNALSLDKIRILQSKAYRVVKDAPFIKVLRRKHNAVLNEDLTSILEQDAFKDNTKAAGYRRLRQYYVDMLESFDVLHFNSNTTKEVYSRYCDISHGCVVSITNSAVLNHKQLHEAHSPVRFAYFGPADRHKGFWELLEACDLLWKERPYSFELHVFMNPDIDRPFLRKHNAYRYEELPQIMESIDMSVIPSQWYETFGFTVLEAMSFGVPVLLTENVGAKDLIVNQVTGLLSGTEAREIAQQMHAVVMSPRMIGQLSDEINKKFVIKTMKEHSIEIMKMYVNDAELN